MGRHVKILKIAVILILVSAGVFFIWLIWQDRQAGALYVSNLGIDSSTCGHRNNPCRSISQAIVNAKTGDTIVVGPGRYGDLNGNGGLSDRGDEFGKGFGLINIDKPVTIISSEGSPMTVLDAGGVRLVTVFIDANDVVFGQPKHGFLIVGAKTNGLSTAVISNVTVAGNTALANGQGGIVINGKANLLHDNFASGNRAAGIAVFGSGNEVRNNVTNSNVSQGFVIVGDKHVIHGNGASNNAVGFSIQGNDIQFLRNAALGNKLSGISVDTLRASTTVSQNNIYGNNSVPLNEQTNCGIRNFSGSTIMATDNFWGMASGPGTDPADNAGTETGCDTVDSNTTVTPFASDAFSIK